MGFTPWPYDATVEAVNFVYSEITAEGDFVAHHLDSGIPWQEALDGVSYAAEVEAELAMRLSLTPGSHRLYLAISPLSVGRDGLAGYWSASTNQPLPPPWNTRAFDSPEVVQAYTAFARDLIGRFQPAYFNLGIEASELLLNDPAAFASYVEFVRQVAPALRADFPGLQLMVSIGLKSPGSAAADTIAAGIGDLLQWVDVVGVSAYPFVFFDHAGRGDPANLPPDWLAQVAELAGGKPVAIAETAWIAERLQIPEFGVDIPATASQQSEYLEALFAQADALDARFIVWWSLVDYDALWNGALGQSALGRIWRDTGLYDQDLNPRPALDRWRQERALPR